MAEPHHNTETASEEAHNPPAENEVGIKERKVSWAKLRRVDSLNMEAGNVSFKPTHHASTQVFLLLHIFFKKKQKFENLSYYMLIIVVLYSICSIEIYEY